MRRELGIDAPEVVEWHGWQLGKAVLKTLVVRNVSTKVRQRDWSSQNVLFKSEHRLIRGYRFFREAALNLVLHSLEQNTVVKFKLPSSRHFQTDYPEPLKLVPGMTARVNVTFKANKDAEYHDELEFETPAGNFKVKLVATRPATRVEVSGAVFLYRCGTGKLTAGC